VAAVIRPVCVGVCVDEGAPPLVCLTAHKSSKQLSYASASQTDAIYQVGCAAKTGGMPLWRSLQLLPRIGPAGGLSGTRLAPPLGKNRMHATEAGAGARTGGKVEL
jgi:hypothetical protein